MAVPYWALDSWILLPTFQCAQDPQSSKRQRSSNRWAMRRAASVAAVLAAAAALGQEAPRGGEQ